MAIVYGFLGAILALGIFAAGVYCGWRMNEKLREKRAVVREQQIGEEERARLQREQQAFRTILNYNTDMAYGVNVGEYTQPEEGEGE